MLNYPPQLTSQPGNQITLIRPTCWASYQSPPAIKPTLAPFFYTWRSCAPHPIKKSPGDPLWDLPACLVVWLVSAPDGYLLHNRTVPLCFPNTHRTHQGIDGKTPIPSPEYPQTTMAETTLVAKPVLGGLYHTYEKAA
ncbi:hypothetical protein [Desulfoscipio gibsoniae]|uniref:hypothetical protein n=1 Tax=Desulfoscipio gibsoniae TaxID=102134 RepID=UPI00059ED794|nr:hypothetical protein [Desulfoscipio gibsoniae]